MILTSYSTLSDVKYSSVCQITHQFQTIFTEAINIWQCFWPIVYYSPYCYMHGVCSFHFQFNRYVLRRDWPAYSHLYITTHVCLARLLEACQTTRPPYELLSAVDLMQDWLCKRIRPRRTWPQNMLAHLRSSTSQSWTQPSLVVCSR